MGARFPRHLPSWVARMSDEKTGDPPEFEIGPEHEDRAFEDYRTKGYEIDWLVALHDGFQSGTRHFAWLAIASRPDGEWPWWVREYLVKIAAKVLAETSLIPKSEIKTKSAKTGLSFLELNDPATAAARLKPFLDELALYRRDPCEAAALRFEDRDPHTQYLEAAIKKIEESPYVDQPQKKRKLRNARKELEVRPEDYDTVAFDQMMASRNK